MIAEYDCSGCGSHVLMFTAPGIPITARCARCEWVAEALAGGVPPEERSRLRRWLSSREERAAPGNAS